MAYPNVQLYINGEWRNARSGRSSPVLNPATEEVIGTFAHAGKDDLDEALEAADKGFALWKKVSAFERSKLMRKAADLLRSPERLQAMREHNRTTEPGTTWDNILDLTLAAYRRAGMRDIVDLREPPVRLPSGPQSVRRFVRP